LNLVPENIGLVIIFRPHEPEFAIRNRAVAMVNETLFSQDEIMAARNRYQDNDANTGQSLGHLFNPI
jgi:predicted CoA-binding protein